MNSFLHYSGMEIEPVVHIKEEPGFEYEGNICRICNKHSDQTYDIFHRNEGGKQIVQMIKEVLPIVVSTCFLPSLFASFAYDLCFASAGRLTSNPPDPIEVSVGGHHHSVVLFCNHLICNSFAIICIHILLY